MSVGRYPAYEITEPVMVSTYLGAGSFGDQWANPVTTVCDLQAKRELVRSAAGEEVVSETSIRMSPVTNPALDLEALFVPESKVTVRDRDSVIIAARPILHRGRLVYLEASLA